MPRMTPADVRSLFPATQRVCYLNAAASSPIATPVEQAISEHYREGVESADAGFPRWLKRREEIRARFARFIGASPGEIAFTASTSMGMYLAGGFLRQRGVREIVTLAGEFPSTTLPFLHGGFALRLVKPREDGRYTLEDIEAAIGPDTGALAMSAVQYASGFRLDVEAVARLCESRGLQFVLNGAQALGQIPLRVDGPKIDFLCGTSHKWMYGGYGVGVFYVRREILESSELPMASWLSVEDPMAMNNLAGAQVHAAEGRPFIEAKGTRFRKDAAALEIGAGAFGILFGFGAALEIQEGVGIEVTEAHNRKLQALLREGLRQRGFKPNAPDDQVAGTCVIPVEGEAKAIVSALGAKGVALTPRGAGVRISTHVFNTEEDVERLFWALESVGVHPAP